MNAKSRKNTRKKKALVATTALTMYLGRHAGILGAWALRDGKRQLGLTKWHVYPLG